MTRLSDYFPQAPLLRDAFDSGIVMIHRGLINAAVTDDSLNPADIWDDHMYKAAAITPQTSGVADWNRSAKGFYYNDTAYRTLVSSGPNVPAKNGDTRRYRMDFLVPDGATFPGPNDGLRIIFNYAGGGSDYWILILTWNGSSFILQLYEFTDPATSVQRGSTITVPTGVDIPAQGFIWVEDQGDTVHYGIWIYERDSPSTGNYAGEAVYSVGSRPSQSQTQFIFGNNEVVGASSYFQIGKCAVWDVN